MHTKHFSVEIFGFILALVIGFLLSILGGGGSILTVPVLVYVFGINPSLSTAYSLLIVGISSAVASLDYLRRGLASPKTAAFFSFPSFVMVFLTRRYVIPALPDPLVEMGGVIISKDSFTLALFAVLMLLAASTMIRKRNLAEDIQAVQKQLPYSLIFMEGLLVGTLTGLVGVGGGFLIIPVLTAFLKLPMKLAVGTSLMIIAINSCIGFLGDIGQQSLDWGFLCKFIGLSLLGVGTGTYFSRKIPASSLKPAFGWFTLAMGLWILTKELYLK